jgi:hypothetical protein
MQMGVSVAKVWGLWTERSCVDAVLLHAVDFIAAGVAS